MRKWLSSPIAFVVVSIASFAGASTGDSNVLRSCLSISELAFSLATIGFDPPSTERQSEILDAFDRESKFLAIAGGASVNAQLQDSKGQVAMLAANAGACYLGKENCVRDRDLLTYGYDVSLKLEASCITDFKGS